jgi:hypothetical protein
MTNDFGSMDILEEGVGFSQTKPVWETQNKDIGEMNILV